MKNRTAFLALFAILAAVAAPSASATAPAASTPCTKLRAAARSGTAEDVIMLFINLGALQVNPACAYDLVTPRFRKNMTRAGFASRKPPFVHYRTNNVASVTAAYIPRVKLVDQVGSWITLDAADRKPTTFEIVALKQHGLWLVDYWNLAVGFN